MSVFDIIPTWQEHQSGSGCWCQPVYREDPVTRRVVWTHRAASDDPHRYTPEQDPANGRPDRAWAVVEAPR